MTIQTKATEQYFPVVLFIMLYKVVLTFESADQILKSDVSIESYRFSTPRNFFYCGTQALLEVLTSPV